MGFVIGTNAGYSTWGSLRHPLLNFATNDVLYTPPGYIVTEHNACYPEGRVEPNPPPFFVDNSWSLLRSWHYRGPVFGYSQYGPTDPEIGWNGYIYWYQLDIKDFAELVGMTLNSDGMDVELEEEAYIPSASPNTQLIDPKEDWYPGMMECDKLKVLE